MSYNTVNQTKAEEREDRYPPQHQQLWAAIEYGEHHDVVQWSYGHGRLFMSVYPTGILGTGRHRASEADALTRLNARTAQP
jgi:hypothetical protein